MRRLLVLLLVAGCTEGEGPSERTPAPAPTVPAANEPPVVTWITPVDGGASREALTLWVQVQDDRDAAEDLVVSFGLGADQVVDAVVPDAGGFAGLEVTGEVGQTYTIFAETTDAEGLVGRSEITQYIDDTPGGLLLKLENLQSNWPVYVLLTDPGDDLEEGPVLDHRYEWLKDGVLTDAPDQGWLHPDYTRRGETWTARVTPIDSVGDGIPGEISGVIENAPPALASVSIGPDPAYVGDLITVEGTVEDYDGDEVSVRYYWSVDDAVNFDVVGTVYTSGSFSIPFDCAPYGCTSGSTVSVALEIDDGFDSGEREVVGVVLQ